MIKTDNPIRTDLRNLTARDFLNLGVREIAYIRPIVVQNRQAYAIHAADGTPLSVIDNLNTAMAMVHHNDLEAVTLH
ncbi:MAG: DUF1150 domain-containing protein [Alphaproteobacteria bacterium]|nr:DUF1150 domain-containing protein [Alphaproteobacteria bacterium]